MTFKDLQEKLKKPERGAHRLQQRENRLEDQRKERAAKDEAKRRDGYRCRWPHHTASERGTCKLFAIEVAHIGHKGMGGDKKQLRTDAKTLITFGKRCHDIYDGRLGPGRSRRVEFLDPKRKANGPCVFWQKRDGEWLEEGREISPGVLA